MLRQFRHINFNQNTWKQAGNIFIMPVGTTEGDDKKIYLDKVLNSRRK